MIRVVDSGGVQPCHLELSPDGSRLAVAHYGDGRVTLHRTSGGAEPDLRHIATHDLGAGRQAHAVRWLDERHLLITDLAGDAVHLLQVGWPRALASVSSVALPDGSGPRHVALKGAHAYVSLETDPGVAILAMTGARPPRLVEILRLGVTPGLRAHPSGVRLSHDGGRLLVLSRGIDLVHVIGLDEHGAAALIRSVPSSGGHPYDAWSLPGWVVVAHEQTRDVVTLPELATPGGVVFGPPTTVTSLPFGVAHLAPC